MIQGRLRESRVEDRRDHERERTDRLHDEDRRKREARELEQDREPEHHGADDPRRPREQREQRPHAQPPVLLAAQLLHSLDTLVLELRAEGEEHRADQRDRDTGTRDLGKGDLIGEIGQVAQRKHPSNLPARARIFCLNGRSSDPHHG